MPLQRIRRFGSGVTQILKTVYTTSEDGYINSFGPTVFKASANITISTSSSSNTEYNQGFWFFDTNDTVLGTTGKTLLSASFNFYVNANTDDGLETYAFYACQGCLGTTLDTTDLDALGNQTLPVGYFWSSASPGPTNGWNSLSMDTTYVNRSGYTNVQGVVIAADLTSSQLLIDSFENASGRKAYLSLVYV